MSERQNAFGIISAFDPRHKLVFRARPHFYHEMPTATSIIRTVRRLFRIFKFHVT